MQERNTPDNIDERYLAELRTALRDASPVSRNEFITEIEQHIAEGRALLDPSDQVALRSLLDRLGSPMTLADAFLGPKAMVPIRDLDMATPWILALGGLAGGIGWLFGLYGIWTSKVWRTTDKVLGSMIFPAFIAIYLYSRAASDSAICVRPGAPSNCQGNAFLPIVIVSLAIPIGVFFRLLWVLYRGQAQQQHRGADFGEESESSDSLSQRMTGLSKRSFLLITFGVVLVIVIGGFVAVYRYQPMLQGYHGEYSSNVVAANGSRAKSTSVPVAPGSISATSNVTRTVPEGMPASQEIIWTEPTGTFTVEVQTTISNTGSQSITVDQLHSPVAATQGHDVHVFLNKGGSYGANGGTPFHTFTLGGHASKIVVIEYQQRCVPGSASETPLVITELPLTYSFFGFKHTVMVPVLPYAITKRQSC
jgi:hypothetical protein